MPFKKQSAPAACNSPPSSCSGHLTLQMHCCKPLMGNETVFGRTVKSQLVQLVNLSFICHPTSPIAMISQFPNCLEALIYVAEEGGLRARFWEGGFKERLLRPQGESRAQDKPCRKVWVVGWFPTEMRAMPTGEGKSCPHAGR